MGFLVKIRCTNRNKTRGNKIKNKTNIHPINGAMRTIARKYVPISLTAIILINLLRSNNLCHIIFICASIIIMKNITSPKNNKNISIFPS